MPIGVICNVLAVALGGLLGAKFGNRMSAGFKEKLNLVFGVCSMGIGISAIVLMKNMPAVVLALIVGSIIGLASKLGNRIESAGAKLAGLFPSGGGADKGLLVTAVSAAISVRILEKKEF